MADFIDDFYNLSIDNEETKLKKKIQENKNKLQKIQIEINEIIERIEYIEWINQISNNEKNIINILSNKFNFSIEDANKTLYNKYKEHNKQLIIKTPENNLIKLISIQTKKEKKLSWNDGPFIYINNLKSNNVGIIGEKFILDCCRNNNITCKIDGNKTKQLGGGNGDGFIKEKTIEIKTARIGVKGVFQHELGEHPWKADYLIFIDILTDKLYLTIMKNFTEKYYIKKDRNAEPYFSNKITRRKDTTNIPGNFKLSLYENNLKKSKYVLLINNNISFECIGKYINKYIND